MEIKDKIDREETYQVVGRKERRMGREGNGGERDEDGSGRERYKDKGGGNKGEDECALGGERGSAWELAASRVCGV